MSDQLREALVHLATRRHDHSDECDGCLNVQTQCRAALATPPLDATPIEGDADFDATATDYRRGSPQANTVPMTTNTDPLPRTDAGRALYDSVRIHNIAQRVKADDKHDARWLTSILAIEIEAAALRVTDTPALSPCWFCKTPVPVAALIAGYDTFDEARLACLACNERMSGNWRTEADHE